MKNFLLFIFIMTSFVSLNAQSYYYQRKAKEASDKAESYKRKADNARDKARSYMRKAANALQNAKK